VAKVSLEARASRGKAVAGGREPASVVVSVTDDRGKPVADLGPEDFAVAMVSQNPAAIGIEGLAKPAEGVYLLAVVPGDEADWGAGEAVLSVRVQRVFDRGQCLAILDLG
jgi:hypothetical protein